MPDYPIAKVASDSQGLDDMDSAAHGVLGGLTQDAGEQAGVILKSPDGKFHTSGPVTSAHDNFGLRIQMQKGWQLAGIYHTHPGEDELGQYFSPQDLQTAAALKVPSYVRFQKDGSVRKYVPGQTQTQQMAQVGNKFGMKVATGDAVPAPQQNAPNTGLLAAQTPVPLSGLLASVTN